MGDDNNNNNTTTNTTTTTETLADSNHSYVLIPTPTTVSTTTTITKTLANGSHGPVLASTPATTTSTTTTSTTTTSSNSSANSSASKKRGEVLETQRVSEARRRLRSIPKLKDGQLSLMCKWGGCEGVVMNQMKDCFNHVSIHIHDYLTQVLDPTQQRSVLSGGLCLTCGWKNCGAQILGSVIDYNRHMYFHVLHEHLKGLGAHLVRELDLGVCLLGQQSSNWIPELPDNLQCLWGQCKIIFDNPYNFYSHVSHHSEEYDYNNGETSFKCQWDECRTHVRDKSKLKDHLRSHMQEKQVACPTCGGLFCSSTKLIDHILRQASSEHKSSSLCQHNLQHKFQHHL